MQLMFIASAVMDGPWAHLYETGRERYVSFCSCRIAIAPTSAGALSVDACDRQDNQPRLSGGPSLDAQLPAVATARSQHMAHAFASQQDGVFLSATRRAACSLSCKALHIAGRCLADVQNPCQ